MLAIPILLLLYFTFMNSGDRGDPLDPTKRLPMSPPQRIISFAPSITEILFELGKGDNVVGVTQFCTYPPAATEREKIGGHVDFNYEAILRLKPDFAILLSERRDVTQFLDKHSIRYITVNSESASHIIASIILIGKACFVSQKGDSLARSLMLRMEGASSYADVKRPTVLLSVSRDDIGTGAVTKVFAAGALSFYDKLIESAGGINVLNDMDQAYPAITAEAIVRLDPDIIIDISSAYLKSAPEKVCRDWRSLKSVSAVNTRSVHCLSGDYWMVPGPRLGLILDDLKRIVSMRTGFAQEVEETGAVQ